MATTPPTVRHHLNRAESAREDFVMFALMAVAFLIPGAAAGPMVRLPVLVVVLAIPALSAAYAACAAILWGYHVSRAAKHGGR